MKTIIMSDLHGFLPAITEEFDLMLLGGDVCPFLNHAKNYQRDWLTHEFRDWLKRLPYKDQFSRVVMCAGNHDFIFEGIGKRKLADLLKETDNGDPTPRLVYLDNEEYDFECIEDTGIETYRIFATPYCKPFGNWAFMRENLDKYYEFIPEGLDILLTHDAPKVDQYGIIREGRWKGENAGNAVLAEHIQRAKPRYAFHGHIHSSLHALQEIDGVRYANVSIMNEDYDPFNLPLVLEIKKEGLE